MELTMSSLQMWLCRLSKDDMLVHDEFFNGKNTPTPHPLAALARAVSPIDFPTPRQGLEFVGEKCTIMKIRSVA